MRSSTIPAAEGRFIAVSTQLKSGFRRLQHRDARPLHIATNAPASRSVTYYISIIFYRSVPRWRLYAVGERGLRTIATERSLSSPMRHAHITFPLHPGESLYLDSGAHTADFELLRATPQGGDWFIPPQRRSDARLLLNEALFADPFAA
jgi:hypothetical protein